MKAKPTLNPHRPSLLKLFTLLLVLPLMAPFVTPAYPRQTKKQFPSRQLVGPESRDVRSEFLHAWRGYKKYAWGHDDLKPLSKSYHDWYAQPLLMTPVDALDTMILMGLRDEAANTRKYITQNLSFDKDIYVQNFEITIRLLGGLLSSYQLTGDKRLLSLAEDLGNRLLPVFDSPTGLPYRFVNLKTGKVRDAKTNPAEAGTLLIEFGTLSKLTRRPVFYQKAKRALVEIYKRRSPIGLVGTWINVETGQWTNTDSHISGAIDSYYEYLLKCWLLFDDQDCKRMWLDSIAAINKYLADELERQTGRHEVELWYGHADMNTGVRTATTYGALDAFFPAVLALSGDIDRAARLQASSRKMWRQYGIEPEEIDYQKWEVVSPGYPLRPEIIESTYYLHHYATLGPRAPRGPQRGSTAGVTHSVTVRRWAAKGGQRRSTTSHLASAASYRQQGQLMFEDFVKYCRTNEGYAALKSVLTKEQADSMPSFLFAETFKYFYLLSAPPQALDFDKVIFNTEAHPIRRTW
jgi:mannosidase alpha-like ER degradation enhancer 2